MEYLILSLLTAIIGYVIVKVGIKIDIRLTTKQKLLPNASAPLQKIPGPKPQFYFGNVLEMMNDPLATFSEWSEKFPGIFLYYHFGQPVVVVTNPDYIKQVLSTNVKLYWKDQDQIIMDVIGNGLLLANGDLWKKQKNLMTPAFGYGYMKTMIPSMVEMSQILIEKWNKNAETKRTFDVHTDITELTLDVIGLLGFGYRFNAQTDPNAILPKAVATVLHETENRIFQFVPFWKLPFWPTTIKFNKNKQILLREVQSMITERREQGVSTDANDLLGRLLAAEDPVTKETISDDQLRDELITFLIAGHETTAAMICFFLYVVSQYPEVAQKLKQEVDDVLEGREPSFEDLEQLNYLDLVIKETMRMYPSVSMQTTRLTVEDDKIGDYTIPKGTNLEIWPWLLHRSSHNWENPLEFIPERHLEKGNRSIFAYIPFGAGSRECIGKRLALFEAKVVLSMILQNFTVHLAPGQNPKPVLRVTLRPDSLIMSVNKRN